MSLVNTYELQLIDFFKSQDQQHVNEHEINIVKLCIGKFVEEITSSWHLLSRWY